MSQSVAPCNEPKRKRVCPTLGEQAEVARQLILGTNASTLMTTYRVSRRTVFNIKKKASDIIKLANESPITLNQKTSKPTLFLQIEQKLYDFVVIYRTHKLPVTISVLQQCALLLKESLLKESTMSEDDRERIKKFSASKGWIIGFVHRFDLQTVRMSGEAGFRLAAITPK